MKVPCQRVSTLISMTTNISYLSHVEMDGKMSR